VLVGENDSASRLDNDPEEFVSAVRARGGSNRKRTLQELQYGKTGQYDGLVGEEDSASRLDPKPEDLMEWRAVEVIDNITDWESWWFCSGRLIKVTTVCLEQPLATTASAKHVLGNVVPRRGKSETRQNKI
jgi:hypothetical protein